MLQSRTSLRIQAVCVGCAPPLSLRSVHAGSLTRKQQPQRVGLQQQLVAAPVRPIGYGELGIHVLDLVVYELLSEDLQACNCCHAAACASAAVGLSGAISPVGLRQTVSFITASGEHRHNSLLVSHGPSLFPAAAALHALRHLQPISCICILP